VTLEQLPDPAALRIAFVPGVTTRKWTRRWEERHPDVPLEVVPVGDAEGVSVLFSGRATVSFVRLPIERDRLSVIRLYGEVPVLVVSRDSTLANRDSVTVAEVAALVGVVDYPTAGSTKDAVALVGALRLPHSVARLLARKDVAAVPVADAPETDVAICWIADETTEIVEEFVGIVRGRTEASSRAVPTPPSVRPKRTATPAKPRRVQKRSRRQGR
jgi:hypothetical protein